MSKFYVYGMSHRPAGPGCQPMYGLVMTLPGGEYGREYIGKDLLPHHQYVYSRVVYDHRLSFSDCVDFELTELGAVSSEVIDEALHTTGVIDL